MKNEKIKRNIAGLLALVQLGLVAGCSSKNLKDGKSETLAAIEEMQDAKSGDEEDLTDAGVVEFNEELLKELGIEFNISQDENTQINISTLNDFLSQYQNVSYSAEASVFPDDFPDDSLNYDSNKISFKYSNNTIAEVYLTKGDDFTEVSIKLMPLDNTHTKNYSSPSNIHTTNTRYWNDEDYVVKKWVHDSTKYGLYDDQTYLNDADYLIKRAGIHTRNSDTGLNIYLGLYLGVYLSKDINLPNDSSLLLVVSNDNNNDYDFQDFDCEITLEEYKTLYDILNLNKSCDIELAIKDALIEIIQRYASEEQSKPLIDILNNANSYIRKR